MAPPSPSNTDKSLIVLWNLTRSQRSGLMLSYSALVGRWTVSLALSCRGSTIVGSLIHRESPLSRSAGMVTNAVCPCFKCSGLLLNVQTGPFKLWGGIVARINLGYNASVPPRSRRYLLHRSPPDFIRENLFDRGPWTTSSGRVSYRRSGLRTTAVPRSDKRRQINRQCTSGVNVRNKLINLFQFTPMLSFGERDPP